MEAIKKTEIIRIIKEKTAVIIRYPGRFVQEHRIMLIQCIPALAIFLLATYRLSEIGQPILFNDEIGYWSNSAFFLGKDWTSVTGRISYYSYGYSLLLVPVRILGEWFGWGWDTMYRAAVVMNAGFLAAGYGIALKLAQRYLPHMGRVIKTAACFTVFTYSSYIVYAHITWTECTLMFFFWVFLYVMMRVTDRPGIGNHIAYAIVSFYIYTVHQRALGIVVASVLIVLYMRLVRRNRVRDVAAFLGSMYVCSLLHAMIKGNLQNVNYLGGEPVGVYGMLGYAFTGKSLMVLAAGIIALILLWLHDRRKYKTIVALAAGGLVLGMWYIQKNGGIVLTGQGENRLSTNDFSGQWGVIRNIFTRNGLIRLGISITGKWFYMASVTGLVVCWGIFGLFQNAFILFKENIVQIAAAYKGRERDTNCEAAVGVGTLEDITAGDAKSSSISDEPMRESVMPVRSKEDGGTAEDVTAADVCGLPADGWKERIWFLGVLLAWFGTFMISAIYKEGFYKNDDLVNGRYTEFVLGFVLLYGLYRLINDRKWVLSAAVYMVLYILAGRLCQYAWDELQRREFELAHCVMFGRVVWNYQVPDGKVAELWRYIMPMTVSFMLLLKVLRTRFPKVAVARTVIALMIPVLAWSYLGRTIVDKYVVVRNEKQSEPFIQFASWIHRLNDGEAVYYISDSYKDRSQGSLQYMIPDVPVTVMNLGEISLEDDAFYVMKNHIWLMEDVGAQETCEMVTHLGGYTLAVRKDGSLFKKWEPYKRDESGAGGSR